MTTKDWTNSIATTSAIHVLARLATQYYAEGYRVVSKGEVMFPAHLGWRSESLDPSSRSEAVYLTAWAQDGFPRVELPARLAGSFAATSFSSADGLDLPWNNFVIQIPPGIIVAETPGSNALASVTLAVVTTNVIDGDVYIVAGGGVGWSTFRMGHRARRLSDLCEDMTDLAEWPNGLLRGQFATSDVDHRALQCVGRIVLSTIAELATIPSLPRSFPISSLDRQRLANGKLPRDSLFALTRSVRVDCRKAITEYVIGGGSSPSVRSLVRGHWKNQPCGPGSTLRKRIHVEPFWRGPEDAPIAVRSHVLGDRT